MAASNDDLSVSKDLNWKDWLVGALEQALPNIQVTIREKNLYLDDGLPEHEDPFYEVIMIYPLFEDLDYTERLDMVWPVFEKMPDATFKKIIGVDCVSPEEYQRRVA